MINNTLFNNSNYLSLSKEYETIAKIKTSNGDKFAVNKGILVITKGGFTQGPMRLIKNLFQGGYNRDTVVKHLEDIASKTQAFVAELKKDPNYLKSSPEELKLFNKKIRQVAVALSDIEYSYRDTAFPQSQDKTCPRLSALYDTFSSLNKSLKEELKSTKDDKTKSPKKPIDFKAPVDLRKIKLRLPSNQSPEDTLQLAKAAESQKIPLWKKVGAVALGVIGTLFLALPLTMLNSAKWILWNPIELAIRGKITTQSPTEWWIHSASNWVASYFNNEPQEALERYAGQLLRTPQVTNEHIKAFCKLAPHVKKLDLYSIELGSKNIDELWSMLEANDPDMAKSKWGTHTQESILELVNQAHRPMIYACDFKLFLRIHARKLHWIDNPNNADNPVSAKWIADFAAKANGYEDSAEGRKRYFLDKLLQNNPFNSPYHKKSKYSCCISSSGLSQVIDAIGKARGCRKISLPAELRQQSEVQSLLKKYKFKQDPKHEFEYKR